MLQRRNGLTPNQTAAAGSAVAAAVAKFEQVSHYYPSHLMHLLETLSAFCHSAALSAHNYDVDRDCLPGFSLLEVSAAGTSTRTQKAGSHVEVRLSVQLLDTE